MDTWEQRQKEKDRRRARLTARAGEKWGTGHGRREEVCDLCACGTMDCARLLNLESQAEAGRAWK